jgi:diguanylate cyclase (GGDEF)-like protein
MEPLPMSDIPHSHRTLRAGKIIFDFGQSSIDCLMRRISGDGATLEVESVMGIPDHFHLVVAGEQGRRFCKLAWRSGRQLGAKFAIEANAVDAADAGGGNSEEAAETGGAVAIRRQMLALRAALDLVPLGIVLLDSELRACFINRAFRRMWALSDDVADRNPTFVALMYHGRDTGAYEIRTADLEAYVAERVRLVRSGDERTLDLRRSNGEVLRMQCTVLPDGGRMLSYTTVTDIVRQSDELRFLRDALENVQDGVLLLDPELNATFMNRKVREFWRLSDDEAAKHPSFASLVSRQRRALAPNLSQKEMEAFPARRVAEVKAGDHVRDLQVPTGRRYRAHCTTMVNSGRMITYCDVTDIIRTAERMEKLATTDSLTGLFNRRQLLTSLEAEWSRFQRYYRSLSVLMLDVDHFKAINDRFGHAVGDITLKAIADACLARKRKSDVVGRIGGEEFAIVLPETSLSWARIVAERLRKRIAALTITAEGHRFNVTASIGIAEAAVSMSGIDALMSAADQALYKAKSGGRNCCVAWLPPAPEKMAAE